MSLKKKSLFAGGKKAAEGPRNHVDSARPAKPDVSAVRSLAAKKLAGARLSTTKRLA